MFENNSCGENYQKEQPNSLQLKTSYNTSKPWLNFLNKKTPEIRRGVQINCWTIEMWNITRVIGCSL